MLGDVGFIADWTAKQRRAFLSGFAEALAESLRRNDPRPGRGFLEVMSQSNAAAPTSPSITGEVSGSAAKILAGRVGRRDDA